MRGIAMRFVALLLMLILGVAALASAQDARPIKPRRLASPIQITSRTIVGSVTPPPRRGLVDGSSIGATVTCSCGLPATWKAGAVGAHAALDPLARRLGRWVTCHPAPSPKPALSTSAAVISSAHVPRFTIPRSPKPSPNPGK